ncbi:hypothetical protein, partial [Escherichia coli]|uniref:hypothetical protein n=1 Tax=Escherichia coli TaxID=562 RepID=UPI00200F2422
HPLENGTFGDISGYVFLHVWPLEVSLQVFIHFLTSWMDVQLACVSFFKYFIPELCFFRHIYSVLEVQ